MTVGDGEQAIARIPIERPDIVLADIGMPKRSGYDVAAFVKGRSDLSHIPVLLLAGAFEPVDETRARQVDCDGVLVKPFEPQQVIARVRELIESSRATSTRRRQPSPEMPTEERRARNGNRRELHRARTTGGAARRSQGREPRNPRSQCGVQAGRLLRSSRCGVCGARRRHGSRPAAPAENRRRLRRPRCPDA